MNEWVTLVLLIPAIVVPIVLLFGFAGCSILFDPAKLPIARPTIVSAKAISASSIRIMWDHTGDAATFQVRRTRAGDVSPTPLPTSETSLDDTGLEEGTTYIYRVVAFRTEDNKVSEPSDEVSASTFGRAFEALAPLQQDRQQPERTIVQRIEVVSLSGSGSQVRIILQRPGSGRLVIKNLFISRAADAGNPYDSAGDLTPVLSAELAVLPDPNQPFLELPPVDYAFDRTKPLLLAFDIGRDNANNAESTVPRTQGVIPDTAARAFLGPLPPNLQEPPIHEASVGPRQPGYSSEDRIYLVRRIEVA